MINSLNVSSPSPLTIISTSLVLIVESGSNVGCLPPNTTIQFGLTSFTIFAMLFEIFNAADTKTEIPTISGLNFSIFFLHFLNLG